MLTHRRFILALAALGLMACTRAAAPGADPASTVQAIYTPYLENRNPPALIDAAPWSAQMQALLRRARDQGRQQGAPVLDFDPIIDGQDWDISAMAVTVKTPPEAGRAQVAARFNNAGDEVEIVYDLAEEDGGWRVDNVRTDHWTLRAALADAGIAPGPGE